MLTPSRTALALALTIAMTFGAAAEGPSTGEESDALSPLDFDPVIVTATRRASEALTTPATINIIDEAQLKGQLVTDFREMFQYEPGITVGQGSRNRSLETSIEVRGIGGQRLVLVVDGVRLPGGYTAAGATLGQLKLDPAGLRRVEVLRGPASSLYGSDALAGVILFRTLVPSDILRDDQRFAARTSLGYAGATNSRWATANLAFRSGRAQHLISATRRQGHELEHNDNSIALDPQDVRGQNLLLKSVFELGNAHTLNVIGEYYRQDVETERPSLLRPIAGGAVITESLADDNSDRTHLGLAWQWETDASWFKNLHAQLDYQTSSSKERTHESRQPPGNAPLLTRISLGHYREPQWSGSLQLDGDTHTGPLLHRWVAGFDALAKSVEDSTASLEYSAQGGAPSNIINNEIYPRKTAPDTDIRNLGLFVQDEIALDAQERFKLTPSLRWDTYRLSPKPDALYANANVAGIEPVKLSKSALTPRLGMSIEWLPRQVIYAGFVTGFRMPTHAQLNRIGQLAVATFIHDFIPAPDLKPERSRGFELGLRGEHAIGSYELTGFHNHYTDFINTQLIEFIPAGAPNNPGPRSIRRFQSRNLGKVNIYGVEAKGSLALHRWLDTADQWHLIAAAQWSRGTDETNAQPLNSIQPLGLVAGLRWDGDGKRYGGQLTGRFNAAKTRVERPTAANAPEPLTTSGYAVFDATGYLRSAHGITLHLAVHNLFDRRYYDWSRVRGLTGNEPRLPAYTSPGRHLSASVEMAF